MRQIFYNKKKRLNTNIKLPASDYRKMMFIKDTQMESSTGMAIYKISGDDIPEDPFIPERYKKIDLEKEIPVYTRVDHIKRKIAKLEKEKKRIERKIHALKLRLRKMEKTTPTIKYFLIDSDMFYHDIVKSDSEIIASKYIMGFEYDEADIEEFDTLEKLTESFPEEVFIFKEPTDY